MDYGYQLLRHVVAQVFGNLGAAARITLVLLAVPVVILLVSVPGFFTGGAFGPTGTIQEAGPPGITIFGIVAAAIAGIVCWLWAAVAWHRFVLLEEYPTRVFPKWQGANIGNYFGNSLLIGLILIGAALGVGIVVGLIVAVLQSPAVGFALGVTLIFALSWIATRIGLILPASAIGERLGVGESWRATAPVSGQIILPIIVFALAATILNQAVIAGFGTSFEVMTPLGPQPQVTLSTVGVLLSIVIWWVQMLVNLALMTTLYGNLIEGRQLN